VRRSLFVNRSAAIEDRLAFLLLFSLTPTPHHAPPQASCADPPAGTQRITYFSFLAPRTMRVRAHPLLPPPTALSLVTPASSLLYRADTAPNDQEIAAAVRKRHAY